MNCAVVTSSGWSKSLNMKTMKLMKDMKKTRQVGRI